MEHHENVSANTAEWLPLPPKLELWPQV